MVVHALMSVCIKKRHTSETAKRKKEVFRIRVQVSSVGYVIYPSCIKAGDGSAVCIFDSSLDIHICRDDHLIETI